ncbi:Uncharacterized conserved protein UCP020606 [Cellulophaga algicola DSM 14237]|uniref:Uncharacterized conserved protein UCP020606 n=1 Tax=Cellulophaga algicola (strain DSM 14237 / IC166 / ACAM 630) TaxID=688270 RepID=E6XED2_CELAD|nr:DUF2238 domain-containing protein [Cellulophaga algicola]ADV50222.1 Uncharacterized conserved protein UCP020606 [Cellulophaga algicola DSM 14237]
MNKRTASPAKKNKLIVLFCLLFIIVWLNSLIGTTDISNWYIENTLTVISLFFLIFTFKRYRFSNFSYLLICIFLCLHVYGSKYTYADNTFGYWLQDLFHSPRNQYDRLVHFSFGFLLYYPMQECFSKWLKYPQRIALLFPIMTTLSVSCLYEIIEWLVADVFFVEQGVSYLGIQGDVWDAQKDMALAFLGAVIAFLFFYGYQKNRHTNTKI